MFDVDDDLSDLGEVVHRFEHLGDVFADVMNEDVVESLHREGKGGSGPSNEEEKPERTHLSKQLIDVLVVIRNSLDELVELIHELSNVDTAERVGLGEGEGEREAMPKGWSTKRVGQRLRGTEEKERRRLTQPARR